MAPRLKERYDTEVRGRLVAELGLRNVMEAPRLTKIVVNCGVGRATQQPSLLDGAVADLATITGQKPVVTRAKRSIAGFKLRQGNPIGAKVTLRGARMWEFFDRLVSLAIPRIRDFRGLDPASFDGRGNYTFGVTEQLIFPEIDYDKIDTVRGMDITICTSPGAPRRPRVPVPPHPAEVTDGQEGARQQAAAHAEVQGAGLHPLPPVRAAPSRVPPVRAVPDLPAGAGARRGGPWGDEGVVVRG